MLGEEEQSVWGKIGNALANAAVGAITAAGQIANKQILSSAGVTLPTAPTAPKAPKLSYLIPLGIAGAVGVGAIALTIKKRKRRR